MARRQERWWLCGATSRQLLPALSAPLCAAHCTQHVTCQHSAVPRSHAALPPRPGFTCIARTSRHATPRQRLTAAAGLLCSAIRMPAGVCCVVSHLSSVVDGTRLYKHGSSLSAAHLEIASYAVPNQLALSLSSLSPSTILAYCLLGSQAIRNSSGSIATYVPLSGLADHSAS